MPSSRRGTGTFPEASSLIGADENSVHAAGLGQEGDERYLWLNVLLQAVRDGCHGPTDHLITIRNKRTRENYKAFAIGHARAYFKLSNADFTAVCELAGVQPRNVIISAREIFEAFDKGTKFEFTPWNMNDVLLQGSDRQLDTDSYYREGGQGIAYLRPINAGRHEARRGMD